MIDLEEVEAEAANANRIYEPPRIISPEETIRLKQREKRILIVNSFSHICGSLLLVSF
jgi:hypothetical protein